jgi:guanylate kinase
MKLDNVVIISGPSGAGEDSIIGGLTAFTTINRVVTTTTREMRPGESQGAPYYFITKEEFQTKIDNNEMIEWAKQYNDNYYGVTIDELERVNALPGIGTWKIEYKGVMTAQKLCPDILSIFIMADSLEILANRIRSRGNVSEEFIQERMEYTKEWLKHTDIYDYQVINREGRLDETIREIAGILKKEGYEVNI